MGIAQIYGSPSRCMSSYVSCVGSKTWPVSESAMRLLDSILFVLEFRGPWVAEEA